MMMIASVSSRVMLKTGPLKKWKSERVCTNVSNEGKKKQERKKERNKKVNKTENKPNWHLFVLFVLFFVFLIFVLIVLRLGVSSSYQLTSYSLLDGAVGQARFENIELHDV